MAINEEIIEGKDETANDEPFLPEPKIIDWLLTVPCVVTFFGVLIVFDLLQRIAILFGRKLHDRVVALENKALCLSLRLVRAKVFVKHEGPLEPDKPYIIVSNHQSLVDIPLLATTFLTCYPRYIAKRELANWLPGISFNLRKGGSAIIDRSNAKQAIGEIKRLGERMKEHKFSTVIFPEGTRARRGKLKKFHQAGFAGLIAAAPVTSVIPVTIDGSWKLFAYGLCPVPCGVRIDVVVGSPLKIADYKGPTELLRSLHSTIENTLSELRKNQTRS